MFGLIYIALLIKYIMQIVSKNILSKIFKQMEHIFIFLIHRIKRLKRKYLNG